MMVCRSDSVRRRDGRASRRERAAGADLLLFSGLEFRIRYFPLLAELRQRLQRLISFVPIRRRERRDCAREREEETPKERCVVDREEWF
ncbi:unnamed protein product [Linum trigynum]|uniref:Uncharacterized protein n=1 Tax=Linum trigynum TaxID=586398 RepID=A0AAV2EC56_9ROSI